MIKRKYLLIPFFLLLFMGNLFATNYYVSKTSFGTGSANSWTNAKAITSFTWSTLVGGDIVYIDGGTDSLTYGPLSISSVVPTSQVIITNGKDPSHNGKAIFVLTSGTNAQAIYIYGCKNIKLYNLTAKVTAAPDPTDNYVNYGVRFSGSSVIDNSCNTIENCHIVSNGNATGLHFTYQSKDTCKKCLIETLPNSLLREQDGINVYGGYGGHVFIGNSVYIGGNSGTHHQDCMQWGSDEGTTGTGYGGYQTIIANNFFSYCDLNNNGLGVGGIYIGEIKDNRFLIYNNVVTLRVASTSGLTCMAIAPSTSTYRQYSISARIYNNTFVNTVYNGMISTFYYVDTLIFKNNLCIADTNSSGVLYTKYDGLGYITYKDIDYNQYYMNGQTMRIDTSHDSGSTNWAGWQSLGYDTHSITGNVNLVNRWGTNVTDYKLANNSNGIGDGTFVGLTTDLVGNPIPLINPDLGALQHSSTQDIYANIKVSIQGLYSNGSMSTYFNSHNMIPLSQPFNSSPWLYSGSESVAKIPANIVDWILVELRSTSTGYAVVARRAAFLKNDGTIVDLDGTSSLKFANLNNGNYYIVIKYINTIQTWSKSGGVPFLSSTISYDFTSAQSQAYGNNLVFKGSKWCVYSGDINQDGIVDSSDLLSIENDNSKYTYHVVNDLNDDGIVDSGDLMVVDTNNGNYIAKILPPGAL